MRASPPLPLAVEPGRGSWCRAGRQRHPRDHLPLHVGDPPLTAVGLDEPHHGDVVIEWMEQVEKQSRRGVGRAVSSAEVSGIDERMLDPVAGGTDHDVEGVARAVGENDLVAGERRHVAGRPREAEVFLREAGAGRVVYFPWDVDRTFWEALSPDHLKLMRNAVAWATNEEPPVTVTGPGVLDVAVWRQRSSLTVHLVNLTSEASWRAPLDELIKVGPFRVSVKLSQGLTPRSASQA